MKSKSPSERDTKISKNKSLVPVKGVMSRSDVLKLTSKEIYNRLSDDEVDWAIELLGIERPFSKDSRRVYLSMGVNVERRKEKSDKEITAIPMGDPFTTGDKRLIEVTRDWLVVNSKNEVISFIKGSKISGVRQKALSLVPASTIYISHNHKELYEINS